MENHNMATNIRDLPVNPDQYGTHDLEHVPQNMSAGQAPPQPVQLGQPIQQPVMAQQVPPAPVVPASVPQNIPMPAEVRDHPPAIQQPPMPPAPQQVVPAYYQQQYTGNQTSVPASTGYLEKFGMSGGVLKEIGIIVIIYVISNLAKTNSVLQNQLPAFLSDDAGIFINVFKGFLFAVIIIAIRKMLF